jgi:hypothetical protein
MLDRTQTLPGTPYLPTRSHQFRQPPLDLGISVPTPPFAFVNPMLPFTPCTTAMSTQLLKLEGRKTLCHCPRPRPCPCPCPRPSWPQTRTFWVVNSTKYGKKLEDDFDRELNLLWFSITLILICLGCSQNDVLSWTSQDPGHNPFSPLRVVYRFQVRMTSISQFRWFSLNFLRPKSICRARTQLLSGVRPREQRGWGSQTGRGSWCLVVVWVSLSLTRSVTPSLPGIPPLTSFLRSL